jgi:hypothetical protein
MTPAEGMSQVNKMVSLSLSPSPSPKWYALHIYTFTSTRCNKRLVSHMCVSSEELLSASGVWANEDKLHTVRKYMCVWNVSICRTVDDCLDSVHSCFHEAVVAPS